MDKRLEKIRRFEANVKDFESYINDRIKQTASENKKVNESTESLCDQYGFTPTNVIPEECIDYIISNIEDFGQRYDVALDKIGHSRISLERADYELFNEIQDSVITWYEDYKNEPLPDDFDVFSEIEKIFG